MAGLTLPILAVGLLTCFGVILLMVAVLTPKNATIQERLTRYSVSPQSGGLTRTLDDSLFDRLATPVLHRLAAKLSKLAPGSVSADTALLLKRAGYPLGLTPSSLLLLQLTLLAAIPGSYAAYLFANKAVDITSLPLLLLGAYVAWRGPTYWLNQRITARRRSIVRALPDALDLLVICVEAGLGFEAALARVAESTRGPFSEELRRTLSEMSLGARRRDALRALAQRCEAPELTSFVAMVVQAEQTGVGVSQVLKVQADAMRTKRFHAAQEEGHKAPLKMLFPLIFFILPATFAVILGPSLMRVGTVLNTMQR